MKISVVIPSFNGQKLLQKNLPQVIKACKNCEIIIVDDASTDNSISYMNKNYPQVKIVNNQKNLGFSLACNQGIKKASGKIIILLNNDVSPSADFLKPLISHFSNPKVFSVGCRELEKIDSKEIISGRTEGEFIKGIFTHHKPQDQESQKTFWTFGGSMAVDRQKFLSLGGFDPIYAPAYWEDIDLCYRAKKRNWFCIFEKKSLVYHNHETTNKKVFGSKKINSIALRNQIIFSIKYNPFVFFSFLPYHLLITNIKTKFKFTKAFISALKRLLIK